MTELSTTSSSEIPDYLQSDDLKGMNNEMAGFYRPPSLKIVQGMTKPPISELFAKGDVILTPTLTPVAIRKNKESFKFIPVYFFPEWISRNPIEADEAIADRSFDATSSIAIKSRDAKTRKTPWEKNPAKFVKHLEVLHFIVCLYDHPELSGVVARMSFSSAEHKTGSTLATSIRLKDIPMIGLIFEASVGDRSNASGQWCGFNIHPPSDGKIFAPKDIVERLKKTHIETKQQHQQRTLIVEDDDLGKDESTTEF